MFVYKWFTSLGNKKEQQEDVDALTKVAAPTNNNNTTSDLPSPVSTKPTPVVTPAVAPQPSVVAKPTPQPEPQEPSTPKKVEVEVKLTVPDKTPKSEKLSVAQLFASYVTLDSPDDLPDDPPGKKLGMNGIMKFVADLDFNPEEIEPLILFYKLDCKTPLIITENEFLSLQSKHSCNDIKAIKATVTSWRNQIVGTYSEFKKFYTFVFGYNKEPGNSRIMLKEVAVPTWKLVFSATTAVKYKSLSEWLDFIENHFKQHITKDIWMQLLEYIKEVGDDLNKYNSEAAWPIAIDDYVSYLKAKQ